MQRERLYSLQKPTNDTQHTFARWKSGTSVNDGPRTSAVITILDGLLRRRHAVKHELGLGLWVDAWTALASTSHESFGTAAFIIWYTGRRLFFETGCRIGAFVKGSFSARVDRTAESSTTSTTVVTMSQRRAAVECRRRRWARCPTMRAE